MKLGKVIDRMIDKTEKDAYQKIKPLLTIQIGKEEEEEYEEEEKKEMLGE